MSDQMYDDEEEEQRARRMRRRAEMRRQKRAQERRRRQIRRLTVMAMIFFLILFLLIGGVRLLIGQIQKGIENRTANQEAQNELNIQQNTEDMENSSHGTGQMSADTISENATEDLAQAVVEEGLGVSGGPVEQATASNSTAILGEDIPSAYGILIDVENHAIVAQKDAHTVINPASMTKILTLLVATEHVTDLEDTFTITTDITDYAYTHDCSAVGFVDGETVTIQDLLYGTILPSGGDAALGLAIYVAGSQEAFMELMNEKLADLGLADTAHFTNCIGIYDTNHHCTVYDMAIMLEAAMENPFCRKVLSTRTYTTSSTAEHPEGITVSNWFLRRIEDKDSGLDVVAGKTGYVVQSGNCAASYGETADGRGYICVTADAYSGWRCIYDHVAVYKDYVK